MISWRSALGPITGLFALAYVIFHVANLFFSFGPIGSKVIHVAAGIVLLAIDTLRKSPGQTRVLLAIAVFGTVLPATTYLLSDQIGVLTRYGFASWGDIAAGGTLLVWMFVFATIYFGSTFAVIGAVFFCYAYIGSYLPAPLTAPDLDFMRVSSKLTLGAMGEVVELSVTVIFVVLLFGSLLQASGAGAFIWRVADVVSRRLRGGTGSVTVISSGLVATFTGVGAANVGITGPIAIPVMKRDGYTPEQAAAIEALASTGGQITPPILGLAAFLMADFLGVPYAKILIAAIVPAFLYYLGLLAYVTIEYRKRDQHSDAGNAAILQEVNRSSAGLLSAFVGFTAPITLLVVLIMSGMSVQTAVVWGTAGVVVLGVALRLETSISAWMRGVVEAALVGAAIGMASGILDVVMASLDITQLGMLVGFVVGEMGGGNALATFLIVIVAAYIMGMGMPGIAVYTVLALTLAPVLTSLGLEPLVAHFILMYMIILSNFTPPVAPTLVLTARIADANYMKAGVEAMKAGASALILPFLLLVFPALLLEGATLGSVSEALIVSIVIILLMTVALCGWLGRSLSPTVRIVCAALPALTWVARYMNLEALYWIAMAACIAVFTSLVAVARLAERPIEVTRQG